MCGIVGTWKLDRVNEPERAALEDAMELLKHRGPDGRGRHIDEDRGLAMGHTRLSIIDLKTGDQPLIDSVTGNVLTVNGEFYDYKTIRAQLATKGHRFQTKSDSEIALHLLRIHGLDFVHHLRGEFAFALYDQGEDRLLLVRDRFGIKPLYYHLTEDRIVYGSEVKAILAMPEVPRALSRKAALNQLMHVMVPGSTAFEGVKAVKPGHMLSIRKRNGRLELEEIRYWDMEFPEAGAYERDRDPKLFIEEVREGLIDAVRTRLEADVPVGCYLSGGIDSCSMLGLATPMQQSPVKAFTISFDHADYDESKIAAEMAERTGADQVVLRLKGEDLYGGPYVRAVWHAERTFYNTLGVAKWHMSRRVHDCGFKVVVTGEGSDELFAGYPFFKRDYFQQDPKAGKSKSKSAASDALFQGAILAEEQSHHPAFDDLCGFTPSWIQPWLLTLEEIKPLLSSAMREQLADYDPVAAIAEEIDPKALRGRHPLDKAQYTWIKTMLEGQILSWGGDRVDMANSMESRPAFLDHHLAELATTIPPELRIKNGVEKWVLREAMKGVLPKTLYERPKFAFMAPPSRTNRGNRRAVEPLLRLLLDRESVEKSELLAPEAVETFLEEWRAQRDAARSRRLDIILNHMLGLQILHSEFVEAKPGASLARAYA